MPDPAGAVLDMTVLATASPAQVEAGLRPIVAGYAAVSYTHLTLPTSDLV